MAKHRPRKIVESGSRELVARLRAWIRGGGDLHLLLRDLPECRIDEVDAVAAVCDALDNLRANPAHGGNPYLTPLRTLARFFHQAGVPGVTAAFRRDGLPRLRAWVEDALVDKPVEHTDVISILTILRAYGDESDVDLIARAARKPIASQDFFWTTVFRFDAEHPQARKMMHALRDPLPPDFIAIAVLDNANALAIAGALDAHPFDSPAGLDRLTGYLRDTDPDRFSHAHSATSALPFVARAAALLTIAAEHPDASVRIEAAWAAAKLGDAAAIARLADYCLDPCNAAVAQRYLVELGHGDAIPAAARDPGAKAMATLAEWLAHPNELGQPPKSLAIVDRRTLHWPPTNDRREVALVRYEPVEGEPGVGMVGSLTFVLFGETTDSLPPEDIYGLHCCWELEWNGDERAPENRSAEVGRALLAKQNPGF